MQKQVLSGRVGGNLRGQTDRQTDREGGRDVASSIGGTRHTYVEPHASASTNAWLTT